MKPLVVLAFLVLCGCSFAQSKTYFGQQVEQVYRTRDTTQNYYLALVPTTSVKGLLVILPGFGGVPQDMLQDTDLPVKAKKEGYLVIIPYLAQQTDCADSISQSRLVTLIPEVIKKFKVSTAQFIIGGHSIGGNGALLYAEQAFKSSDKTTIKPTMVFGVDPPLDMKRLYGSFTYFKKINFSEVAVNEATFFINRFEQTQGGTPLQRPAAYEKISSFYRDASEGGNVKFLKSIPVRLYCDPDVNWYIENRRTPIEYTNLSDLTACIVQLKLLGNTNAELVTNLGKGFFAGGRRHPHAFSQVDADELLKWAEKFRLR